MKKTGFVYDSKELRKFMAENPDLPIVVLVGENTNCGDYSWTFASDVRFGIEEFLDCDQTVNDEKAYTDRDDFREDLANSIADDYPELTDEEFDKVVDRKMEEYEPYWIKVIAIWADN